MSDMERTAVIVGAGRLPTGRFLGGLAPLKAPELGARAIASVVERSGVAPGDIQDVIMGNVVQAGVGQAPARQAAIGAGLPDGIPALTINKVCGSGLKAVMLASQAIRAGDLQVAVAGGMESMSNAPYLIQGYRGGVKFGDRPMVDALIHDGLWCSFGRCHMGGHAEYTAWKADVSREDQDQYAYESHMKAVAAIDGGEFAAEIIPVEIEGRKGTTVVDTDEPPRRDTTLEGLARLRPAFGGDAPPEVEEHSVTAGNAPGLNDGAAATVVTSEAYARANGLDILGRVAAYSVGATAPRDLFFAPVDAVQRLMAMEGTSIDDYGLIEANEAFAVQAIADARELEMDMDRVNVRGGAIALGHPIGASGAKILTTLLYAMRDRNVDKGLATLCLGGGNAVALSVERL
ncbi:MAG: acetyl-CoA C-acyltransferase [Gemmatimonadetes bacterium]|nr:acetyl-CoA C-acyltransferase [Gemmatimonadota bacterium]MBT8478195.1 acetyl-CoA C-acyltransferase [Gemmatimonadota bacterium]NNK48090.1 acetyl-CoA C-acyltransferase [Gemmatimonadota bacterium]